jgi:hypothetical protein
MGAAERQPALAGAGKDLNALGAMAKAAAHRGSVTDRQWVLSPAVPRSARSAGMGAAERLPALASADKDLLPVRPEKLKNPQALP